MTMALNALSNSSTWMYKILCFKQEIAEILINISVFIYDAN